MKSTFYIRFSEGAKIVHSYLDVTIIKKSYTHFFPGEISINYQLIGVGYIS
ncbi:hypothetical protein SAMN05660445_02320 [Salegentibacter salarius]|nr:hypothetical protein SAMN05660445_02320 [Salegentibacter salarius]